MQVLEQINNPDFKVVEFDHFKSLAGLPTINKIKSESNSPNEYFTRC